MSDKLRIIDFHSHILPCADHGSDGIETSKNQVGLMNNAGVDTVVLTPHFYPNRHRVSDFTIAISSAADELIAECDTRPRFCLGAEVLYCDGMEEMEDLNELCIKGTNVLLLELPMTEKWNKTLVYEIKRLSAKYTVILSHIDRYILFHKNELMNLLDCESIHAQINASALFNNGDRHRLQPFIDAGLIHAIGSDLHGYGKRLYRHFEKSEKKLGKNYAKIMENSAELLKNATLY